MIQEVKRLVDESGLKVNPVATRLFFPVLDAASIEDDDDMQTRWAALIANEATKVGSVHPSHIELLKQLAPEDARLLDRLYDWCYEKRTNTIQMEHVYDPQECQRLIDAGEKPYIAFDNLIRLGLVKPEYTLVDGDTALKIVGSHAQVFKTAELKNEHQLNLSCREVRGGLPCPEEKHGQAKQTTVS